MRALYGICGLFLVLAGAFVLRAGALSFLDARTSANWPSVTGRVLRSEVVAVRGSSRTTYGPGITYAYTVGATPYRDSTLSFSTYSSTTSYASDAVAEFRPGAEVRVFYDPLQPRRSVLRPGTNWMSYFLPAVALTFIVFGSALVRLAWRGWTPTGG